MNPDWKTFLSENGAEFDANSSATVESFGNPVREKKMALNGNIMCDLSHTALIKIYGDDARTFLQSQTSNNINDVTNELSRLGSYCTAKGRVISTFRTFQRSDSESLYLTLSSDLLNPVLKRMRMFVMMSKVTLEDADRALIRFGVSGPTADVELKNHLGAFPANVDECLDAEGLTIIRVAGEHPRFEVYGYLEAATNLWARLNVNCAPAGAEAWTLLKILAGEPQVVEKSTEKFVPQMINLQLIDAVSFHKGCYPGQEVVARMHYLGKLKRRMYVARIETNEIPAAGTALVVLNGDKKAAAGNIVNATLHPRGGVSALAVIVSRFLDEEATIVLDSNHDAKVSSASAPPYGFENESTEEKGK